MDWCDGCSKMFDESQLNKIFDFDEVIMLLCDNCYSPKGTKRGKSKPSSSR